MNEYRVYVFEDGTVEWRNIHDNYHRVDGPAITSPVREEYWVNGLRHRIDGPAIEWKDGHTEYWVDGRRHRIDGPAVMCGNTNNEYWIDGNCMTEQQFRAKTTVRELTVAQISDILGCTVKIVE